MAIHWQVKFRSLRTNTLYTVNIYDDNYTDDTLVQLTGAANPFETQEDDSDDPFTPIRTQSGYLRIVDTGKDNSGGTFNWRDLIPATDTDRPVTLTNESGDVMWQGFMQAQNFGARLYETPQEREFPLQCSLTVTSRHNDTYYKQDYIQNFAYLLKTIIDSIPAVCRPTSVVAQGGSDAQAWLLKKIDWQLFFVENTEWVPTILDSDIEGDPSPRFNLYQCLEDMCKFWGWTARTNGQTLYLTCVDDTDVTGFLTLSHTSGDDQLSTMANGTAAGTISSGFVPAGFGTDIFASTDNQDFQMRGPNKAVVTADVEAVDNDVITCYPDGLMKRICIGDFGLDNVLYNYSLYTTTSFDTSLLKGTGSTNADFCAMRLSATPAREASIFPVIRIKAAYSGNVLASLESKKCHSFSDGYIILSGIAYKKGKKVDAADQYDPEIGTKFLMMRIGVGMTRSSAKWWRGTTLYGGTDMWSSFSVNCRARIGGSGDSLYISPDNDSSGNIFGEIPTDGVSFGTSTVMYGKIFIDFLGSNDSDLSSFDLANFKVSFEREIETWRFLDSDRYGSRDYKSENGNNVEDEWSCDTSFASENYSKFGYGVVLNTDFSYFTGYGYNGSSVLTHPEQHLADRVTNYWATSKRKLECKLRTDKIIELTPNVKGIIDGTNVYPIAISRKWRDDTEEVKFIEV